MLISRTTIHETIPSPCFLKLPFLCSLQQERRVKRVMCLFYCLQTTGILHKVDALLISDQLLAVILSTLNI